MTVDNDGVRVVRKAGRQRWSEDGWWLDDLVACARSLALYPLRLDIVLTPSIRMRMTFELMLLFHTEQKNVKAMQYCAMRRLCSFYSQRLHASLRLLCVECCFLLIGNQHKDTPTRLLNLDFSIEHADHSTLQNNNHNVITTTQGCRQSLTMC